MFSGEKVRLRRIEKADLWPLWEWHERDELYLFKHIKSFVSWDEIHDNYHEYFAWKGDFIIQDKGSIILGICSYHNLNWKNRSCSMSFRMIDGYYDFLLSVDAVHVLASVIFNELNLVKIDAFVPQVANFNIQTFEKVNFLHEGILREHIFRNNRYLDVHILSLFREGFNNND